MKRIAVNHYYITEAIDNYIDQLEYIYYLRQQVEDYRTGKLETFTLEEFEEFLDVED